MGSGEEEERDGRRKGDEKDEKWKYETFIVK